jgi:hypothetical protein
MLDHSELLKLLNNAAPAPRRDFMVAAIYFSGFHPTPYHDAVFGPGWSEWELVRRCQPRFPGHRQPIEPAWGCYDESDPAWAAREIDAAADHGIDAWIMDWYWYSGVKILDEALEQGFLKAPNRSRMKFGLMWANHPWANCFPAPRTGPLPPLLPIRHTLEDLDRVIDHCTELYFTQPNYWRIDGRPWFSFFLLKSLLEQLGGLTGTAKALERMRRRAEKNGQKGLYLGCFTWSSTQAKQAREVGFEQVTAYNITHGQGQQPAQALVEYEDVMRQHVQHWRNMESTGLPYWPIVTQGWDVSPRNHPYEPWPPVRWEWPWGHIVVGNTPERFGQLAHAARRFMSTQTTQPKVMVLNAWNEWTEGSVLVPTRADGDGMLKALQQALT